MKPTLTDRRFLLTLAGSLLGLIVLVSIFSPRQDDEDPRPTTYNTGSAGAKAAYLLLQDLGYHVARWEQPSAGLRTLDAAHTTLVIASPTVAFERTKEVKADVAEFLAHGGHVLMTGMSSAFLVEGGAIKPPAVFSQDLCLTTPEGQGRLARIGPVSIPDYGGWQDISPRSRVEQRCGADAVVVRYQAGAGEVVWWISAQPLTNRGLKQDTSVKLLLASIGSPDRNILFEESFSAPPTPLWDTAKGLPIRALEVQLVLVGLLLVFSFGRRSGPVRAPVKVVRSSPLEFAQSMGHLYEKAGATNVATEGARLRLLRFLQDRCGISQAGARTPPAEVVDAVEAKMGGDWSTLRQHLTQAAGAGYAGLQPRTALALVRGFDADKQKIEEQMSRRTTNGETK